MSLYHFAWKWHRLNLKEAFQIQVDTVSQKCPIISPMYTISLTSLILEAKIEF